MEFQLDEHVAHAAAQALNRDQVPAFTPTDAGTRGMADPDLLAWCQVNGRVLVTHERHFVRLHRDSNPHAGIAYCRAGTRSIGEMVESLLLIADAFTAATMVGRVEFL